MATVPTPTTYTNAVLTTTQLNNDRDVMNYLLNKPIMRARSNAAQALTTGTWTSLNLQVEDVDTDPAGTGGHSTSVNTSRFTAQYAGWYLVSGSVFMADNATGRFGGRYAVNGVNINCSRSFMVQGATTNVAIGVAAAWVFLNVADYVEVQGFQENGTNRNFGSATADNNTSFNVMWGRKQ